LLKEFLDLQLDYYFFRIRGETDKMIQEFRKSYDSDQKSIIVHDLAGSTSSLMPAVLKAVTTSVTSYIAK
jgi:hypothetical protein